MQTMLFDIQHVTAYQYDKPVRLAPHLLRLSPRTDGNQRLLDFSCTITPRPVLQSNILDPEGNLVMRLWFDCSTTALRIVSSSRTETLLENPYGYIMDGDATRLPMSYQPADARMLAACRDPGTLAPEVAALATDIAGQAKLNTLDFLVTLNRHLYSEFAREIRHRGAPQNPELTLARRAGACRDLAVLFIALCRSQGIAARFVSGYQAHAEVPRERRYLHAWVEVYIPGGGWCGYDPSHGTAVADGHVAVAASCHASGVMPVSGSFYGNGVSSAMEFELSIRTGT